MERANLPALDFVVIGAYKAATTTLQRAFFAHPEVFVPERKEPSYWAFDGCSSLEIEANPIAPIPITHFDEYAALFARRKGERIAGEVSPEYLKNQRTAIRLAQAYPEIRIVAMLRDPAERAFSDYLMYRRDGRERLESFADALDAQDVRCAANEATGQYLTTGLYGRQLARYYDAFSVEQILVLRQDDLKTDRDGVFGRLAAFLGVSPEGFTDAPEAANLSGVPESPFSRAAYALRRHARGVAHLVPSGLKQRIDERLQKSLARPALAAEDRARLVRYYDDDIALTEELTGLELSAWRQP